MAGLVVRSVRQRYVMQRICEGCSTWKSTSRHPLGRKGVAQEVLGDNRRRLRATQRQPPDVTLLDPMTGQERGVAILKLDASMGWDHSDTE